MRIVHHQRQAGENQVSIERLFAGIRPCLPSSCEVTVSTCPWPSQHLLPRLGNLLHARRQVADVHHIVGDVHYLAFALPPRRLVLTVHDCASLNRLTGVKRELLRRLWFTGPMRRAAVVTTISETTRQELRQWVGDLADRAVVIPNCVGPEFKPTPKPFAASRPVVLQVGTGWNKNVERVAAALRGTPCHLEIIGKVDETQRASLAETKVPFTELGRISDEEVVEAYHRCDLVVFASLYEGFGLPILEAQAVGRPVVTSNRSSMPEAAGAGALLVNPDDVDSIHAAVVDLVQHPELRELLITKGFANVRKFQPAVIAAQYAEVYEQVGQSNGVW